MTIELIHLAVAALLAAAAFLDARLGKIPNWLVYGMLALFGVKAAVFPDSVDLYLQIGVAVAVFAAGLGAFAAGALGAGAVKLVSATMLFMPLASWGWLLATFLAGVFGYMFLFILLRGSFGGDDSKWSALRDRIIPMAWPIGTMGLVGLFLI